MFIGNVILYALIIYFDKYVVFFFSDERAKVCVVLVDVKVPLFRQ